MTPLGTVRSYEDLHRVMRSWVDQRGITYEAIDAAANLADGHAAKLLADPPFKRLGASTFGIVLQAVGLVLLVVPADSPGLAELDASRPSMPKIPRRRKIRRDEKAALITAYMRKIGLKGNRRRPKAQRTKIARRAANARWRRAVRRQPRLDPQADCRVVPADA